MKRIAQSIAGGIFIVMTSAIFWLFGVKRFFIWVMAWPALILNPFLPKPSPDQIFPLVGGVGISITLVVATVVYSLLIYLMLRFCRRAERLP